MENQNNNKNGLFGLYILVGIAILAALFCTPFVAHAETTTGISTFDKLTKFKSYIYTDPSDATKNGKVYMMVKPSNGMWSLEDIPSKISSSKNFLCIFVDGEYDGYLCIYKGSDYNNVSIMPVYENVKSPSGYCYGSTGGGASVTENGYHAEFFGKSYLSIDTPYSIKGNYTADDWKTIFQQVTKGTLDIVDANEKGSADNPEYDKDIGRLVFTDVYFNSPEGITNQGYLSSDIVVMWKNATSTGQSLNDYHDKYTNLVYEYYIENLCTYTQRYTKEQIKFSSYGQKSTIRGSTAYRPEIWIYSSELNSAFDNWQEDLLKSINDGLGADIKFRVYVRPKFAKNSLTVIPDESANAGWVCGRWNSVVISNLISDPDAPLDNESGEFDDEGNWIGDDNDPDDINGGHISSDNRDDFYDKLANQHEADISDYVSTLNSLVNDVETIPAILGKLLSFLPPWVTLLIAVFIGTVCVVGILKLLRG